MKAAICKKFKTPLIVEDIEIRKPQENEVKLKLVACAICHSDIHYMEGAWGGTLPAIYGHEAAGVVIEVGPHVSHVQPGDHTVITLIRSCGACYFCRKGQPTLCEASFALDKMTPIHTQKGEPLYQAMRTGAFAEMVVVEKSQVIKIPEHIPFAQASLLACGVITGVGAVTNTAQVPFGSSVVVIGTGGVGLNSVQGARLCGAYPIIAVDLNDAKLAAAQTFGATHMLNPTKEDVVAQTNSLTSNRGADYVFVTVGSAVALEQGMELLNAAGTLVVVGMPASGVKLPIEAANFAGSGQRILGSKMGSIRPHVDIPKLVALYQEGHLMLDELISGRFPLTDINDAISEVKQGHALRNIITF